MSSIDTDPRDRRGFLNRAGAAMAALLAGLVAPRQGFGSARRAQAQPVDERLSVWIVDFLTVTGRVVKPFAWKEDALRFAVRLIAQEIEAGQVRNPAAVLRRIAANDLEGTIAAYRADQHTRFRGGEVAIFDERVA